jgi:hypothetical protein
MKLVVIHKEPIVERVPNLKSLLVFASDHFEDVVLITSSSKIYPKPLFNKNNISVRSVVERSGKFGIPTLIKVVFVLLGSFFKSLLKQEEVRYIFAGRGALVLAGFIRFFGFRRYISFVVEYPSLDRIGFGSESLTDRLEIRGIEGAKFFITHDDWHAKLIGSGFSRKSSVKHMTIPNSTLDSSFLSGNYSFLHRRLNLDNKIKIILHSGGFGEWFSSSELAAQSITLPEDFRLVFHCSHDMSESKYYKDYLLAKSSLDRTLFSKDPVSNSDLDDLVSSAFVGVAWYNVNVLGFRAEGMGLAAGKIGHYLKSGVPVIATSLPSLNYIEEFECGVLIEDLSNLSDAVAKIAMNYEGYSKNAKTCYEQLWHPNRYLADVVETIKT